MVIPIEVRTPTGCEKPSHPVQGTVFMGFVVPVVRAEKRARTTPAIVLSRLAAWQKRPNSKPLLFKEGISRSNGRGKCPISSRAIIHRALHCHYPRRFNSPTGTSALLGAAPPAVDSIQTPV